jgi:hypothetical protein
MPKKSAQTDQERMFDSNQISISSQKEVAEPKKSWDLSPSNNNKEEKNCCKKIRFKWVY